MSQGTTNLSGSFTGSLFGTAATASYADNFTVGGTLTAQTINVQIITSSIEFNTGSTRNGALSTNTHQFTGSVLMSGSLTVNNGNILSIYRPDNARALQFYTTVNECVIDSWEATGEPLHIRSFGGNGRIQFFTSGSERIRITPAGNVGIGTTTPDYAFVVQADDAGGIGTIASYDNAANGAGNGGGISMGGFYTSTGVTPWAIIRAPKDNGTNGDFAGAMTFHTRTSSAFGERMRITSGGQVLIGVTSAASAFNMQVGTDGGTLAVTSLRLQNSYLGGTTGYFGAEITAADNGVDGHNIQFKTRAGATATFNTRMTITTNGSIGAPTGTNIYNPSDIRLKQNIVPLESGLNKISNLNPVKFNWVDNYEPSENGKDMLGFIAQEVLEVVPEAVESFAENTLIVNGEEISNVLRVNEKFIIPVLVKAIQELKSENDTLKEILQRNNIQ